MSSGPYVSGQLAARSRVIRRPSEWRQRAVILLHDTMALPLRTSALDLKGALHIIRGMKVLEHHHSTNAVDSPAPALTFAVFPCRELN